MWWEVIIEGPDFNWRLGVIFWQGEAMEHP